MRLFCSVLFCLMLVLMFLVGCGGVPEKRNAELVVEYEGEVVKRSGGVYADAQT